MMDNKAIIFPKGVPGFEEHKEFILYQEADSPLVQLVSVQDKEVGFVLLPPQLYLEDYLSQINLCSEEACLLDVQAEDSLEVWAVITLCLSDITKSTVNLRAPIVINFRTQKALQLILSDENYSSRQKLFEDGEQADKEMSNEEGAVG